MEQKSMSELEQEVMDIIWEQEACSVRAVLERISKDKPLAYTTVATILQRLFDKRYIDRKDTKSGYVYTSKLSKESYSKNVAHSFLKKFVNAFGDVAIASFAESIEQLPEKKREYFIKLLKEHDKNK